MKLLHLADLHLGRRLAGFDLLEDQRHILEQAVDLCAARGVDAVVLAGDIYDTALPPAGAVTLLGVLIANGKSQAVTDTKLEELTREVREHNNFARRVPILEEQMKVANHRIADLEKERN